MKKACWICRRTEDELLKDLEYHLDTFGVPVKERKNNILIDSNIGDQKSWICQGCNFHIFNMTHGDYQIDGVIDEFTLATMGDIWKLQKKMIKAFEDEDE